MAQRSETQPLLDSHKSRSTTDNPSITPETTNLPRFRLGGGGIEPRRAMFRGLVRPKMTDGPMHGDFIDIPAEGGAPGSTELTCSSMLKQTFLDGWQLKIFLIAVPIGFASGILSDGIVFTASFFGLIPLAALLGEFTEDIALHSNSTIGAIVNVTFGNLTELLVTLAALQRGMFEVIKLTMIGSVLSNTLLVLGTAFLLGGLRYPILLFNSDAAGIYGPLLLMALLGFLVPTLYPMATNVSGAVLDADILELSRFAALAMFLTYLSYLVFQLHTHRNMFNEEFNDNQEDDENPRFSFVYDLIGLGVVSILISVLSESLVATLQGAAVELKLPEAFIGLILVPIVGNAAEHASGVVMAYHNKSDIALGIALGSGIQISMMVMPSLVLISWFFGLGLNMAISPFLLAVLIMSILVVIVITIDGKATWLEGAMLIVAYLLVAWAYLKGNVIF